MSMPRVTVVTVCLNAATTINSTIDSVLSQDWTDVEYIVIDGASTDGTLELLQRRKDDITTLISEPDSGVYEGMNRALGIATGRWVIFMNAGDRFAASDSISRLMAQAERTPQATVIYGSVLLSHGADGQGSATIAEPLPLSTFTRRIPFCHQATMMRRSEGLSFDQSLRISADYKLFLEIYRQSGEDAFSRLEGAPVAIYDSSTGLSQKQIRRLHRESIAIRRQAFGMTPQIVLDICKLKIKDILHLWS